MTFENSPKAISQALAVFKLLAAEWGVRSLRGDGQIVRR